MIPNPIRYLSAVALACVATLAVPLQAQAQAQATAPITLIVGYPAGGGTDMIARHLGRNLQKELNQAVIVQNMSGAGSRIGMQTLMHSPADGTKLMVVTSDITINQALRKIPPWDIDKDFTHLAIVAQSAIVYAVNVKLPVRSFKEFVEYARANPKKVTYGSGGVGGILHLPVAELAAKERLELVHVPYRGVAPMLQDLMSGQIDFGAMNPAQIPGREASVRALAVTGASRHSLTPNLPTTAEAGYPEISSVSFIEVIGPANLPADVVARLGRALETVAKSAEFKDEMVASGADALYVGGPALRAYLKSDLRKWAELGKSQAITLED